MKIQVITVCKNEEKIIPYFLKYYEQFCDSIIVYDNGSTDKSKEIFRNCNKCKIIDFNTNGKLDDLVLSNIRNEAYKESRNDFDWQFVVDVDQFIYHPKLIEKLLQYKQEGVTIPRIKGFQMCSNILPTEDKQIYEIINTGKPDSHLDVYSVFNPKVVDINYSLGQHEIQPTGNVVYSSDEEFKLLHYRFISYEYFLDKSRERLTSLSDNNVKYNLGCHYKDFVEMSYQQFEQQIVDCVDIISEKNSLINRKDLYSQNEFIFREVIIDNVYSVFREDIYDKYVLDIGANIGFFSLLANDFGAKKIVAVEANEDTYKRLIKNTVYIYNIIPLHYAAFDNSKEHVFIENIDPRQDGCSRVSDTGNAVETITLNRLLDYFPNNNNIVLKVDCEGSEYPFLMSASIDDIRRFEVIFIEIHGYPVANYDISLLSNYIVDSGFRISLENGKFYCEETKQMLEGTNKIYKYIRVDKVDDIEKSMEINLSNDDSLIKIYQFSIIITTFNHCDDLLKPCLDSLVNYTNLDNIEVIVVANGCNDNTKEYVRNLGSSFKLLWFDEPLGYPKAVNIGIKQSKGDFIVLLNNDIILAEQEKNDWLNILLKPFSDNKVGISGPIKKHSIEAMEEFIIFFCVMIHRKVFDTIGLLDEIFTPGGCEDIDFCIRAKRAGFNSKQVPYDDPLKIIGKRFTSTFPIFHDAERTVHEILNWNDIWEHNNNIIRERYNDVDMVNIIIPTYKRHELLRELLNDIVNQTYQQIKVWVCSDGYDDVVENIVSEYKRNVILFDYSFMEHCGGWGAEIRKHILRKISPSGYVVFVDDDNRINKDYISRLKNAFIADDVGITYCDIICRNKHFTTEFIIPNRDVANVFVQGEIDSLNFMVRASIAKQFLDSWNDEYAHDYNFIKNCSATTKSIYIPKILANHRYIIEEDEQLNKTDKDMGIESLFSDEIKEQNIKVFSEIIVNNTYGVEKEDIQGSSVLDIGANIGFFSMLAEFYGATKIVAVEASVITFDQLKNNLSYSNKFNCLNYAAYDNSSDQVFIRQAVDNACSMVFDDKEGLEVQTIILHNILKQYFSPNDNDIILKIDCEGSEYPFLFSASIEDIRRFKIIFIEIHGEPICNYEVDSLYKYIVDMGFQSIYSCIGWMDYTDLATNEVTREYGTNRTYKLIRI